MARRSYIAQTQTTFDNLLFINLVMRCVTVKGSKNTSLFMGSYESLNLSSTTVHLSVQKIRSKQITLLQSFRQPTYFICVGKPRPQLIIRIKMEVGLLL